MPRRNLFWLFGLTIFSLICVAKVSPYGRVLVYAMSQVDQRALEKVDDQTLFEGALEGMMSRLDDYSNYVSPTVLEKFEEELDQRFVGVGMEIVMDPVTKQVIVASPFVGTPAEKAGIRAGDRILRIDGKSTQGLSMEDASRRMRGEPDTEVVLTIQHPGEAAPIDVRILRREIRVDTVLGDTRDEKGNWNFFVQGRDRIGYVRITSFSEQTEDELRKALGRLVAGKMRGLILDLRNNPGGLLGSAIGICDLFLQHTDADPGQIVSTRDRDGNLRQVYYASGKGRYVGFPMAVLVNQGSASASEIVAACLQDHARAVVVGQRSYGKGTVQELIDLEPGQGVLKLTTSSYWRPSERNIHRRRDAADTDEWGVSPDPGYEVKVEDKELTRLLRWRQLRDLSASNRAALEAQKEPFDKSYFDPQLAVAIECVEDAAR